MNPLVTWWLDIEGGQLVVEHRRERPGRRWAPSTRCAASGINNVGIYTSPLTWNGIAGDFQPAVPLWVAWYTSNPQGNCANAVSYAAQNGNFLPTGGVWVTQYTNQANGISLDGDYAC